ncbi:hypothetical protein AMTRI_Chr04g189630 [Amborella trichopoda]
MEFHGLKLFIQQCKISRVYTPNLRNGPFSAKSSSFSSLTVREKPLFSDELLRVKKIQEFACILQSLISLKSPSRAKLIHSQIIVSGLQLDPFLTNNLLNFYSKSGCFYLAQSVFDNMPQRNIITWSALISGYSQHGHGHRALLLFSQFHRFSETPPNQYIIASVLRACANLRALNQASQVHNLVVKLGLGNDVFVGTSLIDSYSKSGYLEFANLVFNELPVRNEVTWTTIITAYSQSGKSEISLELFHEMRQTNVRADRYVISSVLSACSAMEYIEGGKQIHSYIVRNEPQVDVSVNNVLMDVYSKCGELGYARRVFYLMSVRNVVSWTTMIAGLMLNCCNSEALHMFMEMHAQGWEPDGYTCTSALSSCGALMGLEQGKQVHSYAVKTNLESDEFVKNGLVDMYCKCDSLLDARRVFDVMVMRNVVSYNAMIEGYAAHGDLWGAVILFEQMRSHYVSPSLLTFVSLLGVSATFSAEHLSKQIHAHMIKLGISLDLYAGSALVDVYSKCFGVDDARLVFEEMEERDIVVWNAMVSGYAQNGQGEDAFKLYQKMQLKEMKPNDFTFVGLITSASNLAALFHGQQLHNQTIKMGIESDPFVGNALVDMYAKCGNIGEAWRLFESMPTRDIVCWNSMISRYAQHGHAKEAVNLFEQLIKVEVEPNSFIAQEKEIKPNYVTFVGVLSACSHVGLVDKGFQYFNLMKTVFNIKAGVEHYACMIDLLGRAGKLSEAKEFIETMPIEPTSMVWRSLLSACRTFGDINIGKYAADRAISIDPKDSGSYVLLSNIYASKGMWVDVANVRKGMSCNGVVKEPGHSWIEVKKKVHVFVVRDRSRSESDEIDSMLLRLTQQMKGLGYVPDTTFVLHD